MAVIIFARCGANAKSFDVTLAALKCTDIVLVENMIAFAMIIVITVFGLLPEPSVASSSNLTVP